MGLIGQADQIPPSVSTPGGSPSHSPAALSSSQHTQSARQAQAHPAPQAGAHVHPAQQQFQGHSEFPAMSVSVQTSAVTGKQFMCLSQDGTPNGPNVFELNPADLMKVIEIYKGQEFKGLFGLTQKLEQMGQKVSGQ